MSLGFPSADGCQLVLEDTAEPESWPMLSRLPGLGRQKLGLGAHLGYVGVPVGSKHEGQQHQHSGFKFPLRFQCDVQPSIKNNHIPEEIRQCARKPRDTNKNGWKQTTPPPALGGIYKIESLDTDLRTIMGITEPSRRQIQVTVRLLSVDKYYISGDKI